MAERFWLTFSWALWTREVDKAWRRCSFSGFGGIGGAGAAGPDVGSGKATSNGSESKSGGGCFFGAGGCFSCIC